MYYFLRLCSLAVVILSFSSFSNHEVTWREYFQNDLIKIEASTNPCDNEQAGINKRYVFLRISNKTNENLQVSYTKELWYDNVCSNCNGGEESKSNIILKGGETLEGTCDATTKELKMFESMTNGSKKILTKFEIKNVTVIALK